MTYLKWDKYRKIRHLIFFGCMCVCVCWGGGGDGGGGGGAGAFLQAPISIFNEYPLHI